MKLTLAWVVCALVLLLCGPALAQSSVVHTEYGPETPPVYEACYFGSSTDGIVWAAFI
jgi:hypothetical protein